MKTSYGLITRIRALRDVLREGQYTKAEICGLLPHHYQPGPSGARRLGRDINALRELGYKVAVDPSAYTYSIQEMPFLALSDGQVRALALIRETFEGLQPVSVEVLPVLERIAAALPPPQRELYSAPARLSIRMKPAADYRPYLKSLTLLEAAIAQGRKLRFVYPDLDDQRPVTHLGVEPYEILFFDRHFYLLGFSPHDPEMLEFRVDRLQHIEIMAGRAAKHRIRRALPFTYRLSERIARFGVSERFANQRVTVEADGSATVQAEGYSAFRIVQELLRYGEQAELLAPPELRARMAQVVAAMALLYGDQGDK